MALTQSGPASSPGRMHDSALYRVTSLAQVTPRPRSRSLVIGRTRCGKSTLVAALLEEYHRLYPKHLIYILDYKNRFLPVEPDGSGLLFPDGTRDQPHGRRVVVPVVGDYLRKPRYAHEDETLFVVQDHKNILAFCAWQFDHSTIQRPSLVWADESEDLLRGDHRAVLPFRRLTKMGGEVGTGMVVINQEPVFLDRGWFTQSEQLYVGRLTLPADREAVMEKNVMPGSQEFLVHPLPYFSWLYIDQENERMARFSLGDAA